MAEQQFTQEELGQEQVFDAPPPLGPEPKPKATVTPAPALKQDAGMFSAVEQQVRMEKPKEQKVLPAKKEEPPVSLGIDLSVTEKAFQDYAVFDKASQAKTVVASGMIGGMGGFTAQNVFATQDEANAYQNQIKRNKAQAGVVKNQSIKQLSDTKLSQNITDAIFGRAEDIFRQGGKVKDYITTNSAGQDIIDPGKVRKALDKIITANKGDRYMKAFFGGRIITDDTLDTVLSMYQNRGEINKIMPAGVTKKEIDGYVLEKQAQMAPDLKGQVKMLDNILSGKVEKIKQKYFVELTDIGVEHDMYFRAAEQEVFNEVKGQPGIFDPGYQETFQKLVEDRFFQKYGDIINPRYKAVADKIAAEIKIEMTKTNSAINRIYKEKNELLKKDVESWVATKNKELSDKFQKEVGTIISEGVANKRANSKAFAENMINLTMRPDVIGTATLGRILGDGWSASVGGLKNKTALTLNALGFEADWIDEMRASGKSKEVEYSMEKLPLEQNWMKPGYWAQSIASSAPTMAAGMITTALTANPIVGGIVSFMTESLENSGGIMERVLQNTGDMDAARAAGGESFIKNTPSVISDVLFQRMFSPIKLAKGTAKEKIKDIGISTLSEGFTGAWQSAVEQSTGSDTNKSFGTAFFSKEAAMAGIEEAAVGGAIGTGVAGVSGTTKALFNKSNIPSIRTQAITNTIINNGETAAMAGVQLDALANDADEDDLNEGIKEVTDIAKLIEDARQVGLNPQQTQVFVSMSKELADLNANLNTITDPTARKIMENQIAAKQKEVDDIVSGKTPIATIELQPGLAFTGTVDGVRNVMNTPEVKAEVEAGNVNIITDDQALNTEVEQLRTTKEAVPEVTPITEIKTTEDATKISERPQQEVGQPSGLVQREGTQEGQLEEGERARAEGETTQPSPDTRNRNFGSQAQQAIQEIIAIPEITPIIQNYTTTINPGQEVQLMDELSQQVTENEEAAVRQMGQPVVDRVKQWIANTGYTVPAAPAVEAATTMEAAPEMEAPAMPEATQTEQLFALDTKEPTNLEKVFGFLDNIDKSIGKELNSGKLSDATRVIPLAAIQTMVKALKVLVRGGMALQDAIKKVASDNNYTERQFTDALNTIATIDDIPSGERRIPSPRVGRLLGTLKDVKKVTMTEKVALQKQIRDLSRGARDAMSAWKEASQLLSEDIANLVSRGAITAKQQAAIIKKFGKINMLSPKSVGKFVDYMTKVFADAEYQSKLDEARGLKKQISKLSKGKERFANLRDIAKKFLDLEPSVIEDIDGYNKIAAQIKESLRGTRKTKEGVELASIINVDEVGEYIKNASSFQFAKQKEETAAEFQEFFGVDASEFNYDDMIELMAKEGDVPKKDEGIVRSAIKKAFGVYSTVIRKTIATGIDPFTESPVEISEKNKNLLNRFMNMDLDSLDVKQAMQAVDALNNFITNKSTAKMDAVVSEYEGRDGAKEIKSKGIKSVPLKKYFSGAIGKILAEQTTNLGALFEKMFKGVTRGGLVEDKSGLTKVKNGKAVAETRANNIAKEYVTKYYKQKANNEKFNSAKNNVERGMIAFVSRNVIGTKAEIDEEFNRRKSLLLESINVLLNGTEKEVKKGEMYKEIYDKLGIESAKSAIEISSKADPVNAEAVSWWTEKWAEIFPELADVSQGVYNKILDKDTDYNPDRYKRTSGASKIEDLSNEESAFHYNTGTVYKKETGVLMSATRPTTLPLGKRGKPDMYVDLSFDNNNASSMYDALVDINTASAIRQVDGFLKSPEFDDIVNAEDRDLFERRIDLYIRKIRNKAPFVDDELEKGIKKLSNIAAVGVGQALGGITQPIKQVFPVVLNTLINAGSFDVGSLSNKDKRDFINRSGYSIANRGVESQAQIDSINRIIEVAADSNTQKVLRGIEKINNFWLKTLLVKSDAWVARASWITYYEQSLKKQGIDPEGIDWATHQVNEEAGNYAQRMVDRQQNISDPAQAGALFAESDNSFKNFIVKMAMPFASFRVNQSTRLANDLSVLSNWSVSTKEDKAIALRSLGGFSVEVAAFSFISGGLSILIGNLTNLIMGDEEEKKDYDRRVENTIKYQAGRVTSDILSPVPVLDKAVQFGVFTLADDIQNIAGIPEKEKKNIFEPKTADFIEGLGLLGISAQRVAQIVELGDLSLLDGTFEDKYGNKKQLREADKEKISLLIGPAIASSVGILPSESNTIIRNALRNAKKRASKRKSGGGGFGAGGFGGAGFGGKGF